MKKLLLSAALAAALAAATGAPASAQGGEQYIGDIISVGFPFCPKGWLPANGALLNIQDYVSLFSLYGTTYGGDGRRNFGLPDLVGRTPVHAGTGVDMSPIIIGARSGSVSNTLTMQTLAAHTHLVGASTVAPDSPNPDGGGFGSFSGGPNRYSSATPDASLQNAPAPTVEMSAGGNEAFTNIAPALAVNFCVATEGIFPERG